MTPSPAGPRTRGFVCEHRSTLQIHYGLISIVELKPQPFGFAAVLTVLGGAIQRNEIHQETGVH